VLDPQTTMQTPRPTSVVRFGTYEVSLQSGEVRKAGFRIRVQQQPMKLLEILLERPGKSSLGRNCAAGSELTRVLVISTKL
jgi:DNA-binding response OmpR family regulator